jgi:2-polyprenyl-3-methyl-5-hydroxy-6-metoxy-1,4-benzoquinol methylase
MESAMKANLDWWNEVVGVHAHGDTYGLEAFKAGMSRLTYLEREEVGDVAGKSLLHLQCHFGLDTLSWALLGASVTGVDFSETAIALARSLADEEVWTRRLSTPISTIFHMRSPDNSISSIPRMESSAGSPICCPGHHHRPFPQTRRLLLYC